MKFSLIIVLLVTFSGNVFCSTEKLTNEQKKMVKQESSIKKLHKLRTMLKLKKRFRVTTSKREALPGT
jgi:hypothetical protein